MSTDRSEIQVGDLTMEIDRKDIKNLHLSVYPPDGRVRIATPLRVDDESVRLFAISKLSWIKKQRSRFLNQERESRRAFVTGESHYFKGKRYLLNLIHHHGPSSVSLRNKKYIDLYIREHATQDQREAIIKDWYREKLREEAAPIISKWEKKIGVKLNDWGIKQMKTKWGSCSIDSKRIWLNLELAKKSLECLEYVILHEMVHFLERNHNERYKAHLDKYMPTWREVRQELNEIIPREKVIFHGKKDTY